MTDDLARWVGEHLDVRLVDPPGADLRLDDLAGLAVRRNPKRAHLVVSKVLGKHIPTDPRLVYASARLLGDKAAAALGGPGPAAPGLRS
ncbi:phosphoribosyltransferase domain-containing protein, partial [Virgisporangium ochraceum]|uniref:phosphoribosyltransferase domain-containing protein n=1 Tax=Virgisporangium ochraceum TaxID=65505 RepID=UPI001940F831